VTERKINQIEASQKVSRSEVVVEFRFLFFFLCRTSSVALLFGDACLMGEMAIASEQQYEVM
jgi:hypothetical protein